MVAAYNWIMTELNQPDRSDHYLMQVAAEVRRGAGVRNVRIGDFRLKFSEVRSTPRMPAQVEVNGVIHNAPRPLTREDIDRINKEEVQERLKRTTERSTSIKPTPATPDPKEKRRGRRSR